MLNNFKSHYSESTIYKLHESLRFFIENYFKINFANNATNGNMKIDRRVLNIIYT